MRQAQASDFAALDRLYPLPAEDLPRQWVLTRDAAAAPGAWPARALHGWWLAAHRDANVCDLFASEATQIGWIVEPQICLGPAGDSLPAGRVTLAVPAHASGADVEQALYGRDRLGRSSGHGVEGSWVAIVFGGPPGDPWQRVYLSATHSVVYSAARRTVATTHNLVPELRRDTEVSLAFDPLRTSGYYAFGLTAFADLHRLLPNHSLDLQTFTPVRHWPCGALEPIAGGADGAAVIVEHARRIIGPLARHHTPIRLFLSAGRDSRAILAVLRPFAEAGVRIQLSTTAGPDLARLVDLQGARRVARLARLTHEIKWRGRHAADVPAVWRAFVRLGESKCGPALSAPELTRRRQAPAGLTLAGMAGETGRAFFWGHLRPPPRGPVTAARLAEYVGAPVIPPVVSAAEAWLAGLPPELRRSAVDLLDLAYVEQRMGGWESSTRYLYPGRPQVCSPMAATLNIETMLRLPAAYRAARRLQEDMVAYGWPELLQVPFNTPQGALAVASGAERLAMRVRARAGRLRRRLFPEAG